MEKEDVERIIEAIPWRCFHCDFITSNRAEAYAHFGDIDDDSALKPLCKWWSRMDDHERRETLQNMIVQFNNVSEENMRLLTKIEGLEHQIETQVSAIRGYKPFSNCNSIYDVFCLYDTLEGKLLAEQHAAAVMSQSIRAAFALRFTPKEAKDLMDDIAALLLLMEPEGSKGK